MSDHQNSRPNHTGPTDAGDSGQNSDEGQAGHGEVPKSPANVQHDAALDPLHTIEQPLSENDVGSDEMKKVIADHDQKKGRTPKDTFGVGKTVSE